MHTKLKLTREIVIAFSVTVTFKDDSRLAWSDRYTEGGRHGGRHGRQGWQFGKVREVCPR